VVEFLNNCTNTTRWIDKRELFE